MFRNGFQQVRVLGDVLKVTEQPAAMGSITDPVIQGSPKGNDPSDLDLIINNPWPFIDGPDDQDKGDIGNRHQGRKTDFQAKGTNIGNDKRTKTFGS